MTARIISPRILRNILPSSVARDPSRGDFLFAATHGELCRA